MRHPEVYVTWALLIVNGGIAAVTCWGVWRLHAALRTFQQQIFGYRENLD